MTEKIIPIVSFCPYGNTSREADHCECLPSYGHRADQTSLATVADPLAAQAHSGQPFYSPASNEIHVDRSALPTNAADRKAIPLCTGVLDYFTAALAEVAKVSKAGNDQHNPGEELHWARGKSQDQADTIMRHLAERGGIDIDGQRHSAKMAWRALALLQLELESAGAPISRGSK
jgi:hypothetical protein